MVDGQREVFNPNIGTSIPDPNPGSTGIIGGGGLPQAGGKGGIGIVEQAIIQQQEINQAVSDYPGLDINGILGGLPVAEKNQEYFVVFDEAGDTSPEIPNQTQFKIIYVVDSKLNVGKAAHDTVALANITQNFEPQKFATVRADQGTALNPQLIGTYPITAVGSIAPIVGTQIGKGPLQYVTTMSFQLNSQVGLPGGISVAQYNFIREKTWGYNNLEYATASIGTYSYINSDGTTFSNTYNLKTENANLNPPELEMGSTGSYRMYYDVSSSIEDGEAVSGSTSGSAPSSFDLVNSTLYNNEVTIFTGSLEGNTRIRVGAVAAISIATSSIVDLFNSNYSINNTGVDLSIPVKLQIVAETSDGVRSIIASSINSNLNVYNESFVEGIGSNLDLEDFATGTLPTNFSWTPTYTNENEETKRSITWVGTMSGYVDVVANSKIYVEILAQPEELGPIYPSIFSDVNVDTTTGETIEHTKGFLTGSLDTWKNVAATRTYEVLYTRMRIYPEFTSNRFINGVNGLTASYYDTNGSASIYNYTGSYWVGSNNTTSSKGDPICYITASTKLANFYGGEYTQVNPGTEVYNNFNLEQLPSTSLTTNLPEGTFKKDWLNAGFNPLRLPFILQIGDFIRFEYSEDKTYQIIGIFSSGNRLFLTLDRHLDSSTVVDNFVIYRIIKDGQYIILNVEKDIEAGVNQAFRGIILPEYPSEATSAKQDELIFELKKAGIIEDGANNNIEVG